MYRQPLEGPGSKEDPRPFFMPLFTNVLEGAFSEVRLIIFNTNITHLSDAHPCTVWHNNLQGKNMELTRIV